MEETSAQELQEFFERYPVDARGQDYLQSSTPDVIAQVIRDFRPPREGEANYSGLLTAFVKRVRQQVPAGPWAAAVPFSQPGAAAVPIDPGQDVAKAADEFCQRYPMDDRAYEFLLDSPMAVQLRVIREFRPSREGEGDYSALITSFTKRKRAEANEGASQPAPWMGQGTQQLPRSSGPSAGDIAAFVQRYPVDERAHCFLTTSPPEIQAKVMREFRVRQEGQADYSMLMMSFVKKCRNEGALGVSSQPAYPAVAVHPGNWPTKAALQSPWRRAAPALAAPAAARAPIAPTQGPESKNSEAFRMQYPMDDRAYDYLITSSQQVQERVLATFVPRDPHDSDFSAPVTAYVKACRNALDQAGVATATDGFQDGGAGHRYKANADAMVGSGTLTGVALEEFLGKYPIDQRAHDYLTSASTAVIERVLREFQPKAEGEANYSAIVMSFTRMCRDQERAFAASAAPPQPWSAPAFKRGRYT